jgi:hypothetical protein
VAPLSLTSYWRDACLITTGAASLSVLSTGTFNRHLSRVDFRHVVATMHVFKYWPFVRFSPTVRKCDVSRRTRQYLFICQVKTCCIPTTRLYLAVRQMTCVCGLSLFGTSPHIWWPIRQSWERDHSDQGAIWQVSPNMNVCQTNQYDAYALGSSCHAQSWAHLSNVLTVRGGLNLCLVFDGVHLACSSLIHTNL